MTLRSVSLFQEIKKGDEKENKKKTKNDAKNRDF